MNEYEKLGAFYLGKEYDMASRKRQERVFVAGDSGCPGKARSASRKAAPQIQLQIQHPSTAVDACRTGVAAGTGAGQIQKKGDHSFFWHRDPGRISGPQGDQRLQSDIDSLDATFDPADEELEEVTVKPKSTNITLEVFGLTWMPFRKDAGGRLAPDWQ